MPPYISLLTQLQSYVTDPKELEKVAEYMDTWLLSAAKNYTKAPQMIVPLIENLHDQLAELHQEGLITFHTAPEELITQTEWCDLLQTTIKIRAQEEQKTLQTMLDIFQKIEKDNPGSSIDELAVLAAAEAYGYQQIEYFGQNIRVLHDSDGASTLSLTMKGERVLEYTETDNEYWFSFDAPSQARAFCDLLNKAPHVAGDGHSSYNEGGISYLSIPAMLVDQKQLMTFLLKNDYISWEDATTFFDKLDELRQEKGRGK